MTTNYADRYTVPQLDQMILLALQLGFTDDVKHWREVRAQVIRNSSTDTETKEQS